MLSLDWQLIIFILFCVVTSVQLFYYLYFFRRVGSYKPKEKLTNRQHPVSVVICAKDEDENLAKNLPGVLLQKYPSTYEVVVVNDNSEDDTKYFLQELNKEFKRLHIVELTQEAKLIAGKKYPLSIGIREARHEIVLLTDADCVPATDNWVEKMQDTYTEGIDIVLGYGAYHKTKGLLNKLIRFETFHSALQYFSYAIAGVPYMGVGRNLSYKKNLFLTNKGFSSINHIPGGDDDLFINKTATATNVAVSLDPETFTLSVPKKTWGEWHTQKTRHYTTSKYYRGKHKFLLGLYALSQFLFYPACIAAAIFYSWEISLGMLAFKWGIQGIVYYKAMKRLEEKDLFGWWILLDIWQFFYYLIFAPTLFKKAKRTWK